MILRREVNLPIADSFFLFGARGTGKSTLLRHAFPDALYLDLLDAELERELALQPKRLSAIIAAHADKETVILDEIQKLPALLNEVHRCMEGEFRSKQFILTGSSSRKLKSGGANMLGGRALLRSLFPLSFAELRQTGVTPNNYLNSAICFGSLPRIWQSETNSGKADRLDTYVNTYLKEEVWAEQLVRKLDPFRRFLEVAAQCNSKIINIASIARDVGADPKTVQSYFEILEDTLLGFHLDAFHTSIRKRMRQAPKFYFFDNGVTRALLRQAKIPLTEGTSVYGEYFESLVLNEIYNKNRNEGLDWRLSYLRTAGDVEVDLVIERPGKNLALVEIKSTRQLSEHSLKSISAIGKDFPQADLFCLSNDPIQKKYDRVMCLPWDQGIDSLA